LKNIILSEDSEEIRLVGYLDSEYENPSGITFYDPVFEHRNSKCWLNFEKDLKKENTSYIRDVFYLDPNFGEHIEPFEKRLKLSALTDPFFIVKFKGKLCAGSSANILNSVFSEFKPRKVTEIDVDFTFGIFMILNDEIDYVFNKYISVLEPYRLVDFISEVFEGKYMTENHKKSFLSLFEREYKNLDDRNTFNQVQPEHISILNQRLTNKVFRDRILDIISNKIVYYEPIATVEDFL